MTLLDPTKVASLGEFQQVVISVDPTMFHSLFVRHASSHDIDMWIARNWLWLEPHCTVSLGRRGQPDKLYINILGKWQWGIRGNELFVKCFSDEFMDKNGVCYGG